MKSENYLNSMCPGFINCMKKENPTWLKIYIKNELFSIGSLRWKRNPNMIWIFAGFWWERWLGFGERDERVVRKKRDVGVREKYREVPTRARLVLSEAQVELWVLRILAFLHVFFIFSHSGISLSTMDLFNLGWIT